MFNEINKGKAWKHILIWVALYLFWIAVYQKHAFSFTRTMTVEFCYLLFIAANYYFNIYFAIPKFLYPQKYFVFALLFTGGIVFAALLRVPLAMFLNQHYFLKGLPQPGFQKIFQNSIINIFIWVLLFVTAKLVIDKIRFRNYIIAIENEKIKNELDFLKAQFNPHFLFNSINSIYGNIDKNNSTARDMLLTFSNMLRYQLYECNTNSVSIEKEIDYIRNYVALQQTRKPENLSVQLNISEELKGFVIAPLLFISFIENSFKYVSNFDNKLNEVKISLFKNDGKLFFSAYNTNENRNGHRIIEHKGIGIANVKRRLELLYPGKHELDINCGDTSYEIILNLQL